MINKLVNFQLPVFGLKLSAKEIFKHPLFSGSAIMFIGSMFVNVVNYIYHLLMGRLLGPADYGVLASIFSLLYIVSIVPLSTSIAIVKFVSSAKTKQELSSVYFGMKSYIFKVATTLLVLFSIISIPLANFLHIADNTSVFLVGPIMFLAIITLINQATSQGLLRFGGFIVPNIVSAITKFVVGILFVYWGFSVGGAVFGVLLGGALAFFVSSFLIKNSIQAVKVTRFETRKFLGFSFPVLVQALAFTSFFTIDLLLVKHFFPAYEAGLYAALSTLGKIIYFAASPIASAMFPIVSKRHSEGTRFKRVFLLSILSTGSISLGILAFYYVLPEIAIGVLYGEKYIVASENLVWMGVFMSLYTISHVLVNYFLSIGKTFVVSLPAVAALAQAMLIFLFFHDTILQVIGVSIITMVFLIVSLSIVLRYEKFS